MSDQNKTRAELLQELGQLRQKLASLEASQHVRKQAEEELRMNGKRYYGLFENVPISLWEEDWAAVKTYVDDLRRNGIVDLRGYFENNPEVVQRCVEMVRIVDVNRATLKLYQAESKHDLMKGLNQIFREETYDVFGEQLIALAEGHTRFESERLTRTLRGDDRYVYLTLSVAPGHEDTWSRVLLSLSDITKRKQMEEKLKSSREYLERLNDSLQEVIFTVKMPERIIGYVNRSVKDVFGYEAEECLGKTTEFLYPTKKEYQSFGDKLKKTIEERRDSLHTEHSLRRKNGEVFPAEITITFFKEDSNVTQVISILRDVTKRKQGEEALRLSEARLAEAQRIAHLGNWDWDIVKNKLLWSDEIYRIFGLTPQQFGATYEAFLNSVHPEDREFVAQSVSQALYEGKPYNIDHRIVWPDGSVRVVHEKAEVTFNETGKPTRMIGTVHDITQLKLAEEELRALSHRLVQIQEEDRRAIARELHDQVGQSLTVLSLLLDKAVRLPPGDVASNLSEAQALVSELMGQVRDLSLDLRPGMLDDLGLLPTLLWHFDRYTAKTQVQVNFRHSGLQKRIPQEVSTAAYRIVQEALTNVVRHAKVSEVAVAVWVDQDTLWIRIEDKGIGFDQGALPPGSSIGLYGMRERARSLSGGLIIESKQGIGTIITARLLLSGNRGAHEGQRE
jgi:PAS domain S-box-containing protein